MSQFGTITTVGTQLKARLLRGEQLGGLSWCAIGSGDWADKENPPAESANATALANEYGRRQINRSAFLQQDDGIGTIEWNNHLYKEVVGPTAIVAYFTTFQLTDAVGASICEIGLFGGQVVTTVSPFALASQTLSPGTLYWLSNEPQIIKTVRRTYEVIAIFEEK